MAGDRRKVSRRSDESDYSVRLSVPTFAEFSVRYIEDYAIVVRRSKVSGIIDKRAILANYVLPVVGLLRLDEVTDADVLALKRRCAHLNPKTANNILTVLTGMLRVAQRWGIIDVVPIRVQLFSFQDKELEYYNFATYGRLRTIASELGPRYYALLLLAGDAGLRRGEILALEGQDIDLERRTLTVARSVWRGIVSTPKNGKSRVVPMTTLLVNGIKAMRPKKGRRIFVRDDGSEVTQQTLRTWMQHLQKAAGIESLGKIHILRHTFCSHLAIRGAAPIAIQKLAGHSSHKVTQRYLHLGDWERAQAIQLIDDARKNEKEADFASHSKVTLPGFEPKLVTYRVGSGSGRPRKPKT